MGLVVHPGPPDMHGRRPVQELLLDGVLVEAGDGTQPPGDGGAGAAACFQVAGETFDVGATGGEQVQGPGPAPGGELAQIQRVRLSCQPAVSGQEAGESEPFGVLNAGWRGTRAVVVAVIGYLPVRAETDEAGPAAASATITYHHQAALSVTCCYSLRSAEPRAAPRNAPNRRIGLSVDGKSDADKIPQNNWPRPYSGLCTRQTYRRVRGQPVGCGDCAPVSLGEVTSPGVGWLGRYQTGFPRGAIAVAGPAA